jgi:hypothetical protein
MTVSSDGPVALIVGHDENDVWFVCGGEVAGQEEGQNQQEASGHGEILPE